MTLTPVHNGSNVRLMRTFRISKVRLQGLMDLYNLTNASAQTTIVQTFGTSWLRPQAIQTARIVRFGIQTNF